MEKKIKVTYPTYPPDFLPMFFAFIKGGHILHAITVWTTWFAEISAYILTAVLLYHGIKKYGTKKIMLFFVGSFLYTGIEENVMIWGGTVPAVQASAHIGGTYFFNYSLYFFWFGAVPLIVCCTWFVFAYAAYEIVHYLFRTVCSTICYRSTSNSHSHDIHNQTLERITNFFFFFIYLKKYIFKHKPMIFYCVLT